MESVWEHSLLMSQGGIFRLVVSASGFSKFILVVLVGFSVASWAVIIEKVRFFRNAERHSELFLRRFRQSAGLDELGAIAQQTATSPYSTVLLEGIRELRGEAAVGPGAPAAAKGSAEQVSRLRSAMSRASDTEVSRTERHLGFLATTGSVTPFVGLLGTVWGVMSAFLNMGVRGSATLAVVAPGIAEALIATVAGLAAAIPAVVAYNYFLGKVRTSENEMTKFVSEFCDRLSRGVA
ncbi:MAG: MotA/TolQ/ExbB proton channel family protein [Candidatus Eisenbacteria bacterium]